MRNESVAILDVRSNEIVFMLGSRGVNNTFVSNGNCTEKYEGFSTGGFHDELSFRRAVFAAITSVRQNYGGIINEVTVGVPSAFISIITKGHTISFPSKRKLSAQDVEALYDSGLNELAVNGRCIRRSNMYFTLGDNRKYFKAEDLYGVPTTLLKGALSYYFIDETFYETAVAVLKELGIEEIKFIPSTLAQSKYLLTEKKREGYAFLLDVGFLTTSISVLYGNGIVREETYDCGTGTILVALMQRFSVDFATAEEILAWANVSGGDISNDEPWQNEQGDLAISAREINAVIKDEGLDVLCERVEGFLGKHYKDKLTFGGTENLINVTGEGIGCVKGATEHFSTRLNYFTEVVAPDLPYCDKPSFSSRIALLDAAISDRERTGWIRRIFNNFGGKKK